MNFTTAKTIGKRNSPGKWRLIILVLIKNANSPEKAAELFESASGRLMGVDHDRAYNCSLAIFKWNITIPEHAKYVKHAGLCLEHNNFPYSQTIRISHTY